LKVGFISALPPLRSGIPLYTLGLLSGFEQTRNQIAFVVIVNKFARDAEFKIKNFKLMKVWTRGPMYFFQIFFTLMKERLRVVHIQHEFFLYGGIISSTIFPLFLLLLRSMRIKVIVTMHGVVPRSYADTKFAEAFFVPKYPIILSFGLATITVLICKIANLLIVHNYLAKKILNKEYHVFKEKIVVIPHGVKIYDKKLTKTSADSKQILFFGNITPSKGIETLIAAFERIAVPGAKLVIAGGPHPRGMHYFRRIVKRVQSSPMHENILITGYISEERIHSLFEQCDLVVFPYRFSVSSSGSLSLALSHLKPVVVTALPNFEEIITNGKNGLVVPLNDLGALVNAIEHVLLDKKFERELSQAVEETCFHLTWSKIALKTAKSY